MPVNKNVSISLSDKDCEHIKLSIEELRYVAASKGLPAIAGSIPPKSSPEVTVPPYLALV